MSTAKGGTNLDATVSPPAMNPQYHFFFFFFLLSLKTAVLSSPIKCDCLISARMSRDILPLSARGYQSPVSFLSKDRFLISAGQSSRRLKTFQIDFLLSTF